MQSTILETIKQDVRKKLNDFVLIKGSTGAYIPVEMDILPGVVPFPFKGHVYPLFQISIKNMPLDAYMTVVDYFTQVAMPVLGQRMPSEEEIDAICVCYGLPTPLIDEARETLTKMINGVETNNSNN